jgi:hypothetical protein
VGIEGTVKYGAGLGKEAKLLLFVETAPPLRDATGLRLHLLPKE